MGNPLASPHFTDIDLGIECLKAIEHERRRIKLAVVAYALMPDHFHLIIAPPPMRVGLVVHALKNASVHRLKAAGLVGGGLWQNGYFDVALRDSNQLRTAIEYVHSNAAKAGLVGDPQEYALSSCGYWHAERVGPIELGDASAWLTASLT